jgi:uncharacterized membrane protein YqhA
MADPPREGDEVPPTGSAGTGPDQPAAATAEAAGPERARPWLEDRFERGLSMSRIVVVVPVIVLLLAAFTSFAYGTDVFVRTVAHIVEDPELTNHNVGFLLLLTDLFLVGATLMIAGFGLYELFITKTGAGGPSLRLPGWLRMQDLNDLKARVISMAILVASVSFVDQAIVLQNELDALYLGAGVALVIAALTLYLRLGP